MSDWFAISKLSDKVSLLFNEMRTLLWTLGARQNEINFKVQELFAIKDNTVKILKLLQEQQEQSTKIQSLNKTKEIQHNTDISSITELNNSRVATGDKDGYISLFAVDDEKEQWTKLKEEKGHDSCITSLFELSKNILVTSSFDKTLKVWNIDDDDTLTPIQTLEGHNGGVCQVIPLTNDTIASGSLDCTIKIWNINTCKEEVPPLTEDFRIYSLLKLKNKDQMVVGGQGTSVSFWNTKTFMKEKSVTCCGCYSLNGLIELPNHCIAVNGRSSSTIDIIDTETYQLIKQIECGGYINNNNSYSSLHLLGGGTFIYCHDGYFCQISAITYKVLFKSKMNDEFGGTAITSLSNEKYFIADNKKKGISVFQINNN